MESYKKIYILLFIVAAVILLCNYLGVWTPTI